MKKAKTIHKMIFIVCFFIAFLAANYLVYLFVE